MTTYLEFEKPIAELESKIAELRHVPNSGDVDIADEVMRPQDKVQKLLRQTYALCVPGVPVPGVADVPAETLYGPGYDDSRERIPDIGKARRLLDWRPSTSLAARSVMGMLCVRAIIIGV